MGQAGRLALHSVLKEAIRDPVLKDTMEWKQADLKNILDGSIRGQSNQNKPLSSWITWLIQESVSLRTAGPDYDDDKYRLQKTKSRV